MSVEAVSSPAIWDCIVVGAGVIGCSTAYHLAKEGQKILLLEQFCLPHTRGSSHGQSRVFQIFRNNAVYGKMLAEASQLWGQVEAEGGKTIFRETGMLNVQGGNHEKVTNIINAMSTSGVPVEKLSSRDIMERYPMVKFPRDYVGVFEKSAGILLNDRCLSVLQELIVKNGGRIQDGEKVEAILPDSVVTIHTTQKCYKAHKVVLTPGPWAGDLLRKIGVDLPLKAMPARVLYWKSLTVANHSAEDGKFPIIVHWLSTPDRHVYSLPCLEYPSLVKICTRGDIPERSCHPDNRNLDETDHSIRIVSECIHQNYPGISDKPSIVEPCMLTMTPDKGFIIDRHPLYSNIMMGVSMSGHGFMLAPVTGKLLAEMVLERKPSYSLVPFSLSRFGGNTPSKL